MTDAFMFARSPPLCSAGNYETISASFKWSAALVESDPTATSAVVKSLQDGATYDSLSGTADGAGLKALLEHDFLKAILSAEPNFRGTVSDCSFAKKGSDGLSASFRLKQACYELPSGDWQATPTVF